ncbi:sugar diacid recognition domain-containing protein [Cryobacterium sp. CG_9.6]|uniref:CdaR family transcriptional regulator n=1 Tax=Cryobacterium sp. CG_9.6 TaxID=2760710 RepID=UPI002475BA81|nr:sugar diacid recognition domain-containing protein [Cryobacterium sp. CG_9.6]MDH6236839.1 carbohydrate diacid regulator [Cryobacterium sp. CG_9.6]
MTENPLGFGVPAPRIGRDLAQRVVDQVAPSLTYNVNIMDAAGVIIGSMDAVRVGELHAGAREAAHRRDTVQINPGDEAGGTRPGVNIPLLLDGQVVAVVGVTGDPVLVLPVAQVLVLAIQMLLAQDQVRDISSWRESATRDILESLTLGHLTESQLVAQLHRIDAPLQPPWNLTAVIPVSGERRSGPVRVLRTLRDVSGIATAEINGAVWVLTGSSSSLTLALVKKRLQQSSSTVRFLSGRVAASMSDLVSDAQRLQLILTTPALIPAQTETRLAALSLEVAVASLPPTLVDDTARTVLVRVGVTLRETARTFLAEGLSITRAARELHVHRNTVVQRLDRLQLLTGLDIRQFNAAMTMNVALLADTAGNVHAAQGEAE